MVDLDRDLSPNQQNEAKYHSTGLRQDFKMDQLEAFLNKSDKTFDVQRSITAETKQKESGGEETVYFQLIFDPNTGASTQVFISRIETEDDDPDDPDKGPGLSFGVPSELLTTNDPEKALQIASAYAEMIVNVELEMGARNKTIDLRKRGPDYKWQELTEQQIKLAFQRHAEEFEKRGIEVFVSGDCVIPKNKAQHNKTNENQNRRSRNSLLFHDEVKPHKSSDLIEQILNAAKEMDVNPETYLRNQGVNPELEDNIQTLYKLSEQDNELALEVLKSVAENRENASPLAQSLLTQVKSTKKDN